MVKNDINIELYVDAPFGRVSKGQIREIVGSGCVIRREALAKEMDALCDVNKEFENEFLQFKNTWAVSLRVATMFIEHIFGPGVDINVKKK